MVIISLVLAGSGDPLTSSALELAQSAFLPLLITRTPTYKPINNTDPAQQQAIEAGNFCRARAGQGKPFIDAMADNFCWMLPGQTAWSRR